MTSGKFNLLFFLTAACLNVELALAGDFDSVYYSSKVLADVSHVPQATVITDLITKASPFAVSSGLSGLPSNIQGRQTMLDMLAKANQEIASKKGYELRPIELDPRFEQNSINAAADIRISDILPSSSPGTNTFPEIRVSPDICLSVPGAQCNPSLETPQQTPAEPSITSGRIFAGSAIDPANDSFPETVALVGKNNQICSGIVMNNDTVITAAHCVCDGADDEVDFGTSVISPTKRMPVDKKGSITFQPCDKIQKDLSIGDLGIVKILGHVDQPVRSISSLKELRQAASVRAVGFGKTETSIGFKYQVNIVIASWQCDGTGYQGISDHQLYLCQPSYEMVAAGFNKDTCNGDSGAPIYIFGEDTKPYLVGVTSRGITPDSKCGNGGVYVLLSASPLREWLVSHGIQVKG